ncbi:sigma-70 family RNA polymerase sigma factor [Arthrobacter rhizosphaerae]|uniref:sigma-70 family RNA polymerase sigma factor n=1 Tax=Arthrobacter rhizosphaerae TaxID=2855490 RepID=UPI001FF44732|nr:sigma-70 family RNA polymerase sigma factor [Arthrobacter rhizosphaerae]
MRETQPSLPLLPATGRSYKTAPNRPVHSQPAHNQRAHNQKAHSQPEHNKPANNQPRQNQQGQIQLTFQNHLVLTYLDLAESLAARFVSRGRERADLNQVAYLGLVKAARGFDESRGGSFPAYATPTITGELKRYLRDRCWMVRPPRHIQDLRTEILRTEPLLSQRLRRSPTDAEIALELGADVACVREAMAASASLRPDSLDAVDVHSDAPPPAETLVSPDASPERLEELLSLSDAIQELSEADRQLLYRRYFLEESQSELGQRVGMTQMQVSRRLSKILVQLQQRLLDGDTQSRPRPRTASSTS